MNRRHYEQGGGAAPEQEGRRSSSQEEKPGAYERARGGHIAKARAVLARAGYAEGGATNGDSDESVVTNRDAAEILSRGRPQSEDTDINLTEAPTYGGRGAHPLDPTDRPGWIPQTLPKSSRFSMPPPDQRRRRRT